MKFCFSFRSDLLSVIKGVANKSTRQVFNLKIVSRTVVDSGNKCIFAMYMHSFQICIFG